MARKILRYKSIYIDVCALGRRYDDQNVIRIELETAAVQLIIAHAVAGTYKVYYSPMHEIEIGDNPDVIIREELLSLLRTIGKDASLRLDKDDILNRARSFISGGMGVGDAVHVAYAEAVDAAFITCDDALIKKCSRHNLKIWYGLPDEFVRKERIG